MLELKPMKIEAGAWQTPVLRFAAIDGTQDPKIVRLVFEAGNQLPAGHSELTMGVAISTLDASALLDALQKLQGKGLIPTVPQQPQTKQ